MDNALYVGLSRQMVLRREMDIVANNIANSDTTGFKVESLMQKTDPKSPPFSLGGSPPVKFVTADGVEGQGFFKVTAEGGERFTRDGHLRTDEIGRLVTQAGAPVLDDGGGEITLDPEKGQVSIAADGTLSQGDERVGKIGVFTFESLSALEKTGDNLFQNTSNLQAQPAAQARVRQGLLEGSNVQPILEITRMIEVSRAYESTTRMMDSESELARRTVERMGRVQ